MPHFLYLESTPVGARRAVMRGSWLIEAERCRTRVERALPDSSVEIYFNLGPEGRHEFQGAPRATLAPRAAWIVGPRARSLLVEKEVADCNMVSVRLELGVAARAFALPASALADSLVDLDVFWGRAVESIRDQLASADTSASRLDIVTDAVAKRLGDDAANASADDVLVRALCRAAVAFPTPSIADVAARCGVTHRRAIALFDEHVGLKPKAFQRVRRLRRALRMIHATPRPTWTEIAHACGYFDQAHFLHDFERLAGISPTDYEGKRSSVGRGAAQHLAAAAIA